MTSQELTQRMKWYGAAWWNARRVGVRNSLELEEVWWDIGVTRVLIVFEGTATSSTWTGEAVSALAV